MQQWQLVMQQWQLVVQQWQHVVQQWFVSGAAVASGFVAAVLGVVAVPFITTAL